MLECWNSGDKNGKIIFKLSQFLSTHHSAQLHFVPSIPLFHYSLRGVGPTLRPVRPTGWKRSRRPIVSEAN